MTNYGFVKTMSEAPEFKEIDDPYWKLVINSINWEKSQHFYFKDLHTTVPIYSLSWYGDPYVGLHASYSSNTTGHIIHNVTLPEDGLYWVVLKLMKHPQNSGLMQLYVDDVPFEEAVSGYDMFEHDQRFMYHPKFMTAGVHEFDIYLTRQMFVESIMIYKIDRYVGCSDKSQIQKHSKFIDVEYIEFDSNSENDPGTLIAEIPYENGLKNALNESGYVFDFCDPITLILGHNKNSIMPKFSGYVLYPERAEDNILKVNCIDSMLDAKIQLIYRNISIGSPTTEISNKLPISNFGNANEMVRYLGSIWRYPINVNNIDTDNGFYLNFGSVDDFNSVSSTNLVIEHDFENGHPKPGLKAYPGISTGAFSLVLFNSAQTWDAIKYPYLSMDYSNLTTALKPPIPFNILVYMHKYGEAIANAVPYPIVFSGDTNPANKLGVIDDVWNGAWPGAKFNLKEAFDKIAPSSEYNISKIELAGTFTQTHINERLSRNMWLDNIMSYRLINDAPLVQSSDVKYIIDIFKELNSVAKRIIYIRPGMNRADDSLVCVPKNTVVAPVGIDEKSNVRIVSSENYDPEGDGLYNQKDVRFTFGDGQTEGQAYAEDIPSTWRYKAIGTYEAIDVNNQVDADKIAKDGISENAWKKRGYTVMLDGNILFEPPHYAVTSIGSRSLVGNHDIKAIKQIINIRDGDTSTQLDMLETSKHYKTSRKWINHSLANMGIRMTNSVYGGYRI